LDFVDSELEQLKKNHLYRKLRYSRSKGGAITIQGRNLVNLCSNDYLGIPTTSLKIKQFQSSSRLVSGNDDSYQKLEKKLARHKSQQASLIYPTGYMANLGAISSIAKKGDLILSDELNHASIIESCKLTGAKIVIYRHNDMKDLQEKAKVNSKNKFVITEGVFSMDGDFSNLKEITEIAQKKNLITILDDAHGDFVVGQDGKGTANHFGVSKKIDLYISSLSKGLGSFGGYVASDKNVVDLNINKSKSFIYTSAIPSFLVEYSLKRFESDRKKMQKKLQENVKNFSKGLQEIGYKISSTTHIIPIIIGNEKSTMRFGEYLFKNGVHAQPIRYPTVPKNKARLRISITSWLTHQDIEKSINVFDKAYKKYLK
jgi:glycine C-acetyltransferase